MEMEAAAEVIAYIFAAVAATTGLILAWHCCPRWRIRLVWTGGTPRLYKYKWRGGGFRRGSLDNSSEAHEGEQVGVTDEDLKTLLAYIDEKNGGPPWHLMMDRSTSTLSFRAWRRDPKYGPTQYRSQTIFENMEPELLRDFFWDDEFRAKWDDMLVYFRTLQEYPHTGTVINHWIRKFPFFCSNREYIIGRRMWVSGSTYYCVSKSIPFPGIPRSQRPRRVDLYYSSWCIREVESRIGGTASEVLLFHFEDMGIQKMLAKAGVQRGMWKLVQKLEQGVCAYQVSRQNGAPPSRYALLARIATPVSDTDILRDETCLPEDQLKEEEDEICGFVLRRKMLKWLLAGGIMMSWGLKHKEIDKRLFSHIIQHIRNIHSSKEDRRSGFITENEEIAKQLQELGSASKPLEELIQKAKSTASRQGEVLREQTPVSELLAWIERVSQPRSRWRASWPQLFMVAMKIFGW